jgi:hypothetical protein
MRTDGGLRCWCFGAPSRGWTTPALYPYRTMKSWCVILAIVQINGWWEWFIVMHLAPAWLAGSMQTVRKFTEHLGMFGDTIVSMTRTVVYADQCNGRVFPNHVRAVLDMLTNLSDPRVGPQWRAANAPISPIYQPQASSRIARSALFTTPSPLRSSGEPLPPQALSSVERS